MRFPEPPLLLITDRRQSRRPLGQVVADAIAAGCRWISVREKDLSDNDQVALLRALLPIARCTVTPHQQKRQTPMAYICPLEAIRSLPAIC